MPTAKSSDGVLHNFPEGTSQEAIDFAMKRYAENQPEPSPLRGYRADEPVTFGPGDFIDTLGHVGGIAKDFGIGALDLAKTAIPGVASRIGAGALAAPTMFSDPEASQQILEKYTRMPPLVTPQGQGFAEGIAPIAEDIETGVTDLFGNVPGGPVAQAGARTAVQAPLELLGLRGLGSGAGAAANSIGRVPSAPAPGSFIPSVKDLFNSGRVAFTEARISGGGLKPEFLQRTANRIRNIKDEKTGLTVRFSERTNPIAHGLRQDILDDLDSGSINFDDLMELRQQAGSVAGSMDASDARLGSILKNQIDDIIGSITPDDVLSGNPQRAAQSLETANKFWRDANAARTIEKEMELAANRAGQFSGSGYENALRTQFRQLHARIIKGRERGFKPNEVAAIKRVADGGPVENLLRYIGKLAPTGVVSGGAGAGLGYLLGGPIGAAVVPATGALGRLFATRSTIGNANRAMELPLRRSAGLLDQ
jgi:hypothetical protein